jgi:hypothetical protein
MHMTPQVGDVPLVIVLCSPLLDHVQIDNIRRIYPGFDRIYQRHLENKFNAVKGPDFRFLKERLLLVQHLLRKNQDLDHEKRAELIQALFSEGNLHEAQKILPNSNKKDTGLITKSFRILQPLFGGQRSTDLEAESLTKEMKKIAGALSDSEFLLGLKSIEIDGLQTAIQETEMLAYISLSSSIDDTVKKMTQDVVHMQQESCKKKIQKAIQVQMARALSDSLVKFIRDLNAKSAGRKKSYVRAPLVPGLLADRA